MDPTAIINSMLSRADAAGSRSTVIQPLIWLIITLTSANIAANYWSFSVWLQISLGILLILAILIFIGVYLYFAIKNPDALRSENFTLSKMAIEKNIIGDSTTGFREIAASYDIKTVSALDPSKEIAE